MANAISVVLLNFQSGGVTIVGNLRMGHTIIPSYRQRGTSMVRLHLNLKRLPIARKTNCWQEQLAINAFMAIEEGYNLCPTAGNRLGSTQPQSAKERISQSLFGNQYAKGMKHSSSTRTKISLASKGNQHAKGSKSRQGQSNDLEHRRKLSESHKGVGLSEEHKRRISTGRRLYLQNKLSASLNEQAAQG
jgi:hypothetical protein